MTRDQLANLTPFNEDADIQVQEHCQHEIEDVLSILYGYVQVADIPDETRKLLLDGLAHISCHIKMELKELTTEVEGRVN